MDGSSELWYRSGGGGGGGGIPNHADLTGSTLVVPYYLYSVWEKQLKYLTVLYRQYKGALHLYNLYIPLSHPFCVTNTLLQCPFIRQDLVTPYLAYNLIRSFFYSLQLHQIVLTLPK